MQSPIDISNNNSPLQSTDDIRKEARDNLLQAMKSGKGCLVITDEMCNNIMNNMVHDTPGPHLSLAGEIPINTNEK